MFKRKRLVPYLVMLGMMAGSSGAVLAATSHDHAAGSAPVTEMVLNNGQKWQTDDALRKGMTEIRSAIADALHPIHEGRFAATDFVMLADKVQEHTDFIVANCKLPAEADLQLHFAVAQILDGVTAMKEGAGQDQGVVHVIQALNAYGEHFDHPGWVPISH